MNRAARPLDAVLALAATWAAIAPMRLLFDSYAWVNPALGVTVVSMLVGIVARALIGARWLVVVLQALAAVETFSLLHLRGHLWHGLPVRDAFLSLNYLLYDARMTVMQYAAPAPADRGIVVALSLIIGALAIFVDAAAVTRRSPAVAGLGLLAGYLLTATNSGDPLPWHVFALPAGLWLIMLGRSGIDGLRRWSTTIPLRSGRVGGRPINPSDGFADAARNLGILSVAVALIVPWAVPHPSTRFLGDGLGRSSSRDGGGKVALATTLDLKRNLEDRSQAVWLRYRSTAAVAEPLRVAVVGDYGADGQFRQNRVYPATPIDTTGGLIPGTPDLRELGKMVKRDAISVEESRLDAPQIALPDGVTSIELPSGVGATRFGDGTIDVADPVDTYSAEFTSITPSQEVLEQSDVTADGISAVPGVVLPGPESLVVEPAAAGRLDAILDRIVPEGASDLEAAVAMQDYLRSDQFTYSLTLIGPTQDANGRLVNLDPVSHFLMTKQGYCQQFATAMIMLARRHGIPARMVIGFLPGSLDSGVRQVRAADAHAWPELFFEPMGWVRFEPTPGARSGSVPSYTRIRENLPSASGSATSGQTRGPSQRPDQPELNDPGTNQPSAYEKPIWQRITDLSAWTWVSLALILGLLGTLVVPVTAGLRRRRRLARAADDAARIEVRWHDLVDRLGDLGISTPESLTPRQAQHYLADRGVLDSTEKAALGRVVAALERARYAPPSDELPDPGKDVETVVTAVGRTRSRRTRLTARLLPGSGRRALADGTESVLAVPRRGARAVSGWTRGARERATRRRRR